MTEVLTPLTDKALRKAVHDWGRGDYADAHVIEDLTDFARTLERRIATLEQQLAEANAALQAMRDKYEPDNSKYAQAIRQAVNEPEGGGGEA